MQMLGKGFCDIYFGRIFLHFKNKRAEDTCPCCRKENVAALKESENLFIILHDV